MTAEWVLLGCTVLTILVMLATLFSIFSVNYITALLASAVGSFFMVGALSDLLGGGSISLAGLMYGDFGACDERGYFFLILWGVLFVAAFFLHTYGYLAAHTWADLTLRCLFCPVNFPTPLPPHHVQPHTV